MRRAARSRDILPPHDSRRGAGMKEIFGIKITAGGANLRWPAFPTVTVGPALEAPLALPVAPLRHWPLSGRWAMPGRAPSGCPQKVGWLCFVFCFLLFAFC